MNAQALTAQHARRSFWQLPLFTFLVIGASFFVIEHDWDAQITYQDMISASSIEELATGQMFEQSRFRQIGGLALFLLGALVFAMRNKRPARGLTVLGWLVLLFLAWNFLSILWADDLSVTARRLVFLAFLCVGAAGMAAYWRIPDVVLFTMLCTGAYLVAGVTAEVMNDTFRPFEGVYRFAGTLHPNAQAVNCALFIFSVMAYRRLLDRGRFLFLLLAIAGFAFLYLTKSRTAFASTSAVILMYWGLSQATDRKAILAVLAASFVAFFFLLQTVLLPLVKEGIRMGREEQDLESIGTLTGRTELWDQLLDYAWERPLLGYGYGGFWNESRSEDVMYEQGWPISHAHNAYIDIVLDSGVIAALVYMVILLISIRLAYVYDRAGGRGYYAFFVLLLIFCALNGVLESVAIQRTLVTFLSMIVLVHLAFFRAPAEYEEELADANERRREQIIPVGRLNPAPGSSLPRQGGV